MTVDKWISVDMLSLNTLVLITMVSYNNFAQNIEGYTWLRVALRGILPYGRVEFLEVTILCINGKLSERHKGKQGHCCSGYLPS